MRKRPGRNRQEDKGRTKMRRGKVNEENWTDGRKKGWTKTLRRGIVRRRKRYRTKIIRT